MCQQKINNRTCKILRNRKGIFMKIIENKIKCKKCGDIIESKTIHDFKRCKCGAVAVDGGHSYLRREADSKENFEELSIYQD
jgi:Zn finger protein HypA/HybF involved in hydrogenase expression